MADTDIDGKLKVEGDTLLEGKLNVEGETLLEGKLKVEAADTEIDGNLKVEADTEIGGSLKVEHVAGGLIIDGDLMVTGNSTTIGEKHFMIDHPLDHANKYLIHASVESSDRMNIYSGTVKLDGKGEAWINLPKWFEALNGDFRYQLTPIGAPAPNLHIADDISKNRFRIAGGQRRMKVSWQVTGIRCDAYALAHPMRLEVTKEKAERGMLLHPIEHGKPEKKRIHFAEKRRLREQTAAVE